jgi:hypothetical protein
MAKGSLLGVMRGLFWPTYSMGCMLENADLCEVQAIRKLVEVTRLKIRKKEILSFCVSNCTINILFDFYA